MYANLIVYTILDPPPLTIPNSRSKNPMVQPFLHGRSHILSIYVHLTQCAIYHFPGRFSPSRAWTQSNTWFVNRWTSTTYQPIRHLDRVSRFSTVHVRYQRQTDRLTERTRNTGCKNRLITLLQIPITRYRAAKRYAPPADNN